MLFSLIIPTVNHVDLVLDCIRSFLNYHDNRQDFEFIIVDDGSSRSIQDLLLKALNQIYRNDLNLDLILNKENEGFAKSVNKGIRQAQGEYIILVNNDITFIKPILPTLERLFDSYSNLGIVGGRLLYPDNTIQHAGMSWSKAANMFLHSFKHVRRTDDRVSIPQYKIAVTGALFSFRKPLTDQIGLFNEDYFLACEDAEYCLRAWKAGWKVLYHPEIEAIHLEGFTRGKTLDEKKERNQDWHDKEIQSINKFRDSFKKYNIEALLEKVVEVPFYKPSKQDMTQLKYNKLEVGSGYNPHPGYIHLDIRRGLPELDKVCDFSKDILPYPANTFIEVLANHVIEHISWRKINFVVKEWLRVLVPGGKLVLRTPDLRFIVDRYLSGEITPEHPNDEGYIKSNLSSDITPAWWANIKLFSGQDYDANFHHVCFDFNMINDLLRRIGFKEVRRIKLDREFSPGELQVEAVK